MANAYLGNYRDYVRAHAHVPDVVVDGHLDEALNHVAASRWGTNTYVTAVVYYAADLVEQDPMWAPKGPDGRYRKAYERLLGMQVTELFSGLV